MGSSDVWPPTSFDELGWKNIKIQFLHSNWGHDKPTEIEFNNQVEREDRSTPIVVGLNGAGKTTLLKTIHAFFDLIGGFSYPSDTEQDVFIHNSREMGISIFNVSIEFYIHFNFETPYGSAEEVIPGRYLNTFHIPWADSEQNFSEQCKSQAVYEKMTQFTATNTQENIEKNYGYPNFPIGMSYEEYITLLYEEEFRDTVQLMLAENDNYDQSVLCKLDYNFDFINDAYSSSVSFVFENSYRNEDFDFLTVSQNAEYLENYEKQPFGEKDFFSLVIRALDHFEKELGIDITYSTNQLFQLPIFSPKLVGTETNENPKISGKVFEIINREDIDSIELEISLAQLTDNLVLNLMGTKLNEKPIRTYEEWPENPNAGSYEIFSIIPIFNELREVSTNEDLPISINKDQILAPLFLETRRKRNPTEKTTKSEPNWDKCVKYYAPQSVWCINLERVKSTNKLIGAEESRGSWELSTRILRKFGDVIFHMGEDIIYSKNRESLADFVRHNLFRHIDTRMKCSVLSKLFQVDPNELLALYRINELGAKISPYLTSGQRRLYSILKNVDNEKNNIILIDEPEVSLHIDWQRQIVDLIRKVSVSNFLLISTHSPDVIYHHHDDVIDLGADILG